MFLLRAVLNILEAIRFDLIKEAVLFEDIDHNTYPDFPPPPPSSIHVQKPEDDVTTVQPVPGVSGITADGFLMDGAHQPFSSRQQQVQTLVLQEDSSRQPDASPSDVLSPAPTDTLMANNSTEADVSVPKRSKERDDCVAKLQNHSPALTKQTKITTAFDKIKRKLSPNKEADTTKENIKVPRNVDTEQ